MERLKKIALILLALGAVFLFFFPQLQEAIRGKEIQLSKEDNLQKAREAKQAKAEMKVLKEIEEEQLLSEIANDNKNEETTS